MTAGPSGRRNFRPISRGPDAGHTIAPQLGPDGAVIPAIESLVAITYGFARATRPR